MKNTAIEWCDHTFNPWVGCTKVSPACDHCYAERSAPARVKRAGGVETWGPNGQRVRTSKAYWREPLKWNAEAERTGTRPRVFCASLADVFDNAVPPEWRADLFDLIADTRNLDWLLLTKRVGNVMKMANEVADMPRLGSHTGHLLAHQWRNGRPPKNVWLGATVVNQEEADRDITKLLAVPAAKRFLSIEPLLGQLNLTDVPMPGSGHGHHEFSPIITGNSLKRADPSSPKIDWVIVGGESGPGARPMHPDWVRSLRDQCTSAGVKFFFKQWGAWRPPKEGEEYSTAMGRAQSVPAFIIALTGTVHCFENHPTTDGGSAMLRVGKKSAGRLLDGREWDEVPV